MHISILITGANGQVGQELQFLSQQYPTWTFHFFDRNSLDISDEKAVRKIMQSLKPDFLLNCAAYTAVDKAESDIEACTLINATAPAMMASICAELGIKMIHISSDYVYHSESLNRPYLESDPTTPKGIYAKTKLEGDLAVLAALPTAAVLRTSWVYSSFGNNFVKTMLRLGRERAALNIVSDQVGAPTHARDLAHAMLTMVKADLHTGGIFHYANEGVTSWYDFAVSIFQIQNIPCKASPILTEQYPTPAQRPHWSYMNKAHIRQTYQLDIPHWQESLRKCLELLG